MTPSQREHFEIARRFGRVFSTSEYRYLYRQEYPNRKVDSIMPAEFYVNRHPASAKNNPKFLRWISPGECELGHSAVADLTG
jgi:hypothetical protein